MKCDDCLNLLEAYLDGEASEHDSELVRTHLATCSKCANEFEALMAEGELYARYDREIQISPVVWNGIAARIATETPAVKRERSDLGSWFAGLFAVPRIGFAFSGALAVLIAMVAVGYFYLRPQPDQRLLVARNIDVRTGTSRIPAPASPTPSTGVEDKNTQIVQTNAQTGTKNEKPRQKYPMDDPGVLFTDAAYADIAEKDTASHLEQAQKLLVSFRSLPADDDQDVDVTYEKSESRRLLNENVVLRRDAEMAGKFPTKTVLGSLEPFLIDIANLPDKASSSDVRQIKDRVQKTEIVAELRSY